MPITSTHLSQMHCVIFRISLFINFESGKSGQTLINNRAMKGNGFDTGSTSQINCYLSRFRSESWCSTIVRERSLICIRIRNSFPFEWLCTRTRFETEACSNSEMGYLHPRLCSKNYHNAKLSVPSTRY